MIEHPASNQPSSRLKLAPTLIASALILAAISGWLAIDANGNGDRLRHELLVQSSEASRHFSEAGQHAVNAAIHRAAILEESVREAPSKDGPVTKRLALSIALMKRGTGFEDRVTERLAQNATDQDIETMRASFLTSLFENYPPALKRQEAIQMQMDALLIELKASASARRQEQAALDGSKQALSRLSEEHTKETFSLRAMMLLILSALFGGLHTTSHKRWAFWLCVVTQLGGMGLLIQSLAIL